MDDCIFCDIVKKNQPAKILYETERVIVIDDIMPKAPVHMLVIPKDHIVSAHSLELEHKDMLFELFQAAKHMADERGIGEKGYKLVFNVGKEGGQIINHLHLHVLGGKRLED